MNVLLADEHLLFRAAVAAALDSRPDFRVVAKVADGRAAVAQVARLRPDVALLSATLPGVDGVEACAQVKRTGAPTKVLVMTDEPDQAALLQAVLAGADGYITMSASLRDLAEAAHAACRGETIVPPDMLGALLRDLTRRRREEDSVFRRFSRLSRREKQVLGLLVHGLTSEDIARALVLSRHTIRTHLQNILEKLEVHSRLEAAALAIRYGLVERPDADATRPSPVA